MVFVGGAFADITYINREELYPDSFDDVMALLDNVPLQIIC